MIYWHLCPGGGCQPLSAPSAAFLSEAERQTYDGLRFAKRRQEWLLGRWTAKQLVQRSLAPYRALPLAAISVHNDPDGAPYLSVDGEGRLPASISISHRAGRAACALSPALSPAIGIDLERVEPRAKVFVEDFFTAREAARVWACPEVDRERLVTVIWSAKEAALKAVREGLRLDTRSIEVGPVIGLEPAAVRDTAGWPIEVRSAGDGRLDTGWQPLAVRGDVSGVLRFAAWWRPAGESVVTLAAAWP
jgi:4'-phosphopantetheinyl transferase